MKYELVMFDADGTLFDYQKGEEFALKNTMESFGLDFQKNLHLEKYREINLEIWRKLERGEITPKNLRSERFRLLFEEIGISLDAEDFGERYLDYLSQSTFLIDGALEILERVKDKFTMILISNGLADVQNRRLDLSPLRKYFEHFVISGEIGTAKPDPEIFRRAFQAAGHEKKERAIIIGDSLSSDIRGGVNFGIDTCWFNPEKQKNKTELKPTCEIERLQELEKVLL